ncbi:phage DNA packaging protein J [Streptomyces sp. NPDC087290]|uniref:phage DNA packaging protein J n=1 Tax=Streptomyces sp. NPDC087290 TaxID=3365776 RepID=UPI00380B8BB3
MPVIGARPGRPQPLRPALRHHEGAADVTVPSAVGRRAGRRLRIRRRRRGGGLTEPEHLPHSHTPASKPAIIQPLMRLALPGFGLRRMYPRTRWNPSGTCDMFPPPVGGPQSAAHPNKRV